MHNQGHYFENLYSYQGHNLNKIKEHKKKKEKKKREDKVNVKYLNIKSIILMSK